MAEDEKPKLTMKADSAKIRVEELAEPIDRAQEICTQIKNNVYNVPHYNQGNIEVIDVIEDWDLGFHEGNIIKYVARAKHKGEELEDLEKAKWYLERLIYVARAKHKGEELEDLEKAKWYLERLIEKVKSG